MTLTELARPTMSVDVEHAVASPVFVLAPPRSFTSVVCGMLGQHPDLYGFPELQSFCAETVSEWWGICAQASYPMIHGMLRAVAELVYGEQTEESVAEAYGWLRRRLSWSTGLVFEELASRVGPRRVVEKSPSTVYDVAFMQRVHAMFPNARFLHLVRHPSAQAGSVHAAINAAAQHGPVPQWLLRLGAYHEWVPGQALPPDVPLAPELGWLQLNQNILEFLATVPAAQQCRVRGEDVLADPATGLGHVAEWLGIRTDDMALAATGHPETSPFAGFGPPGARLGNDANFLRDPHLRPERAKSRASDSRAPTLAGLPIAVRELAGSFGYA